MRYFAFVTLIAAAAASNLTFALVSTVQICTTNNSILSPADSAPVRISRIAWPLNGPAVGVPLIADGVAPDGDPNMVCMAGCSTPPCLPVTLCNPFDLWWSVGYSNLVVNPGEQIVLPEMIGAAPTILAVFSDVYVAPSATATPTATPTITSSPRITAPTPIVVVQNEAPTCTSHSGAVIGLSVTLAILATSLFFIYFFPRSSSCCPYCAAQLKTKTMITHLQTCKVHLSKFEPIVIDPVRTVQQPDQVNLRIEDT